MVEFESSARPKRGRGRPTAFDRSAALQQAMRLFWDRGYEGSSFDDLIAAMGISASSFYNSFGSKQQLYQEATEAYAAKARAWFRGQLDAATDARTAFHRLLAVAAREFTQSDQPTGCMISLACTNVPPSLAGLRDMMAAYREAGEAAMATRIRRGIEDGDVPKNTDAEALAAFCGAVLRGMAVQARDGATRERLQDIAEFAMHAWPAPPQRNP